MTEKKPTLDYARPIRKPKTSGYESFRRFGRWAILAVNLLTLAAILFLCFGGRH